MPPLAPVMPPIFAPIVHEKLLGAEAIKPMLVLPPLQIFAVLADVMTGAGFTVTVIVNGAPIQDPAIEVGVTTYATVPDTVVLGLVRI